VKAHKTVAVEMRYRNCRVGAPGRQIISRPTQTDILHDFSAYDMADETYFERVPELQIFFG
jgi:hypothetical protein